MKCAVITLAILLLVALCVNTHGAADQVLGDLGTMPTSSAYKNFTAFSPASGAPVAMNPPIFTWTYRPRHTLTNVPAVTSDIPPPTVYIFRFELSTNNFASTNWSIVTRVNFYNFLPCITNADGTTYSNTCQWRVWYHDRATNSVLAVSDTNTFTMPASARRWDRSALSDRNTITNLLAVHPHMGWSASNAGAMFAHLSTNDASVNWVRPNFLAGVNTYTNLAAMTTNGLGARTNFYRSRHVRFQSAQVSAANDTIILTNVHATHYDWGGPGQNLVVGGTQITFNGTNAPGGLVDGGIYYLVLVGYDPVSGRSTNKLSATLADFGNSSGSITMDITSDGAGEMAIWADEVSALVPTILYIGSMAFAAMDTNNAPYQTNYFGEGARSLPVLLNFCATEMVRLGGYKRADAYTMGSFGRALALAYDWLYPSLTTDQRTNIRELIKRNAKYLYWQFSSVYYQTNAAKIASDTFDDTFVAMDYSGLMNGDGHGRVNAAELGYYCMAAMGEEPELWEPYEWWMNYIIAIGDPLKTDEGSYYGFAVGRGYINYGYIMAMNTFRHYGLTNISTYRDFMTSLAYRYPLGYRARLNHFGDLSDGQGNIPLSGSETIGIAARATGDGSLYRHWKRGKEIYGLADVSAYEGSAFFGHYFPGSPTESDMPTGYVNTNFGWTAAGILPPTDYGAFTNNVSFVMSGRPFVNTVGHATYHDAQPSLRAYGTHASDLGVDNYAKNPMFGNGLHVRGFGGYHIAQNWPGIYDWHARILLFTNTTEFAASAVDTTRHYARRGFRTYGEMGSGLYNASTNSCDDVTMVRRHLLQAGGKQFFALFDTMQGTTNTVFEWHWPILEDTLVTNGPPGDFRYTATNHYNGSNVTWIVKHEGPAGLRYTNLVNGYYTNPFTREDYSQNASFISSTYPTPKHNIWLENATPATNHNFLSVIYPVKWGKTNSPTIVFRDYRTACVTNAEDNVAQVIFFGPLASAPADATMYWDVGAIPANGEPPQQGGGESGPVIIQRGTITPGARINGGRLSLIIQQSNDLRIWSNYLTNEIAAIDPLKFYRLRIQ